LNPQYCKPILPNNVLNWWEKALCESVVPEKNKFYCPFYNCSTLLIREMDCKQSIVMQSGCSQCIRAVWLKLDGSDLNAVLIF
jgi:E3 ubiquitin-protein ligase RNF144